MSSSLSTKDIRKPSLEGLVSRTVPFSLVPREMSQRTLEVVPSPPSDVANHQTRGLGDKPLPVEGGSPNDKTPQSIVRSLRDISRETPTNESDQSSGLPLKPREEANIPSSSFRQPLSSESDTTALQQAFQQLDQQEETRRRYTLQTAYFTQLMENVSWEESAEDSCHLWAECDTREACYLNDTQFCQDQKLSFSGKRHKVRCSACRIMVHTSCMRQLYYEGVLCKTTFREIKQKVKNTSVHHHFLKRRKLFGKCGGCGRSLGNFKNFSGRAFEGFSCSWCGDSYHTNCFSEKLRDSQCHLGPLRNLIIPPSWIIKLPNIDEPSPDVETTSGRRKKSSRRRTRRNPSTSEDRASKYFTVKPLASSVSRPTIVFINPKSGGNQGSKLLQTFQWLLNPRQVFDLSCGGPKFGLQMFKNCSNLRILACGGDGTVGWVLSIIDQLNIKPLPPVAVLPLGTGNDLARVLNWGGAYADEPLDKILMHVEDGPVVEMDRWVLAVWRNQEVENRDEMEGKDDVPLHVVNNYFSIGADAQVSLDFHESREANPQKFNTRIKNKFFYSRLAGQDLLQRKFANLTDHIRIIGDGIDFTNIIRQLRLESICLLNIPSYGSGCHPWGTPTPSTVNGRKIGPQYMNDGMIEVLGFWASTFPMLIMGAHGERLAQCQHIKIYTSTSLPVQIDGEACKLKPSIIELVLQNKALMVRKEPLNAQQAPLKGLNASQQLKMSVSKITLEEYNNLNSDFQEIKKIAVGLGLVLTTPSQTLHMLRPQIDRFTKEQLQGKLLSKNWQYLDIASNGRLDKVFQILPEQEESIIVGNMLCDGIYVVEHDSPPTSPPIILGEESTLDNPNSCRSTLVRNTSYNQAISSPSDDLTKTQPSVFIDSEVETDDVNHTSATGLSPLLAIDVTSDSQEDEPCCSVESSYKKLQKMLFDSVKRGNLKKIKEAHSKGARLANVDENGLTPLHHAARLGRTEVVQYIVENIPKEALDLQDEDKAQTALHKAAWYGYHNICKILVEAGASLYRTDYQGNTPYLKSIESEDEDLQQYLLMKYKESRQRCESEEYEV